MRPTIGRVVIYRSRTGAYDVPAVITATVQTLNPKGVLRGFVCGLSSAHHVHLTVFTPGLPQRRGQAEDFVSQQTPIAEAWEAAHGRSENVAGCYQEWDVPVSETASPGTWRWPERVEEVERKAPSDAAADEQGYVG